MRFVPCATVALLLLAATPLLADDVTGSDRLICAPMVIHECRTDSECVSGAPWKFDIGPFVEIDLKNKRLQSTSLDRATDIDQVHRDGELVIVQAYEKGRAFNMVLSTPSGFFTSSITLDDGALTIFGACKTHEGEK